MPVKRLTACYLLPFSLVGIVNAKPADCFLCVPLSGVGLRREKLVLILSGIIKNTSFCYKEVFFLISLLSVRLSDGIPRRFLSMKNRLPGRSYS